MLNHGNLRLPTHRRPGSPREPADRPGDVGVGAAVGAARELYLQVDTTRSWGSPC